MALSLPPTGDVGEDRYQPLAEINVTPMVDVMLVLLVIFMVTAPLLTVGVPLDLPKTSAAQVTRPSEPVVLSLDRDGDTFIGSERVEPGDLKDRLSRYSEIDLSVTGRKSGRTISQPVWFVWDNDRLYLLPVKGSDTQWYKNVLKDPLIRIDTRGADAEFQAVAITDQARVSSVVEKFRAKYGASDVKKYYSKFDVAVVAQMR